MNEAQLYNIIGRPIVTEKTTGQRDHENKIAFAVARDANKIQIRQAIEQLFNVRVVKVNTMVMPSKPKRMGRVFGRRAAWKKAIITLAPGESIEFYETEGEI